VASLLLVEDNELNRDMLSRRLIRSGYQLLLAVNGEEAIQVAESKHPDLILMDMSLPVLSGWEATKRLKSSEHTSSIPIIALTAHAMAKDREEALACGCDDYDTKPVELPRLLQKITMLLSRGR
jgi:two-component system cell cycle response regulator DivK